MTLTTDTETVEVDALTLATPFGPIELTPAEFDGFAALAAVFPEARVVAIQRRGNGGVISSRRIVSASSRMPGAAPKQGTVYRARTQRDPRVVELATRWAAALDPVERAARRAEYYAAIS